MKKYVISAILCAFALTLTACGEDNSPNEPVPSGTIALTQTTTEETQEISSETTSASETETSEAETTVTETEASEETTTVSETETTPPETTTTALSTTTAAPETAAATETTAADFSAQPVSSFIINGVCYSAADNISVKDLGNQSAPASEYPSCMGDGVDCAYSFTDFIITMYKAPNGAESFVSLIVTGSAVTNPKGLNIGISEAEALAILGDYYAEENGVGISFITDNGVVTEVDYIKLM